MSRLREAGFVRKLDEGAAVVHVLMRCTLEQVYSQTSVSRLREAVFVRKLDGSAAVVHPRMRWI